MFSFYNVDIKVVGFYRLSRIAYRKSSINMKLLSAYIASSAPSRKRSDGSSNTAYSVCHKNLLILQWLKRNVFMTTA